MSHKAVKTVIGLKYNALYSYCHIQCIFNFWGPNGQLIWVSLYLDIKLFPRLLPKEKDRNTRENAPTKINDWKCNFHPVCQLVCRLVPWSVCLSLFPQKGGKLLFHAPIGALVTNLTIFLNYFQRQKKSTIIRRPLHFTIYLSIYTLSIYIISFKKHRLAISFCLTNNCFMTEADH